MRSFQTLGNTLTSVSVESVGISEGYATRRKINLKNLQITCLKATPSARIGHKQVWAEQGGAGCIA